MNTAQKSKNFEVSLLDDDTIAQVTFNVAVGKDEDGEAAYGFIIVGKNSPQYQDSNNSTRIENIMRASKRSKQIDSSTEQGAKLLAKTVTSNEFTTCMAVTVGWFGFDLDGQPMDFDKNVVEKMWKKFPQWQVAVQAALDVDANFMKV